MLTEKDFCDYDTCVALKEMGITACGLRFYEKGCPNTLYQNHLQPLTIRTAEALDRVLAISLYYAQKWLREEKGIFVYIDVPWKTDDGLGWSYFCCNKPMTEEDKEVCFASGGFYDSYEEALIEGIKASVKILKEK